MAAESDATSTEAVTEREPKPETHKPKKEKGKDSKGLKRELDVCCRTCFDAIMIPRPPGR